MYNLLDVLWLYNLVLCTGRLACMLLFPGSLFASFNGPIFLYPARSIPRDPIPLMAKKKKNDSAKQAAKAQKRAKVASKADKTAKRQQKKAGIETEADLLEVRK